MNLDDYLKKKKLTQEAFGRLVGISKFHTNKLVRGKRTPSFKLAKKIQEVTCNLVTINDFSIKDSTDEI